MLCCPFNYPLKKKCLICSKYLSSLRNTNANNTDIDKKKKKRKNIDKKPYYKKGKEKNNRWNIERYFVFHAVFFPLMSS